MHYTVAVITEDGDYESALEPFSEHRTVSLYLDKTKEDLIKEKREDLEFAKKSNQKKYYDFLIDNFNWENDEALFESIKSRDDLYYTYDEEGNRYTDYNPDSKWDWYELGGRWTNKLKLKPAGKKRKALTADEAMVKDIDFQAYELTPEEYERYSRRWDVIVEEAPLRKDENAEDFFGDPFETKKTMLTDYGDKETYLKEVKAFRTAALLYKGKWYSPESKSCISDDAGKIRAYNKKFEEILSQLQPDDVISIIDCHI